MTCEEVQDRLDAYALGALDPEEAQAVEKHLSMCAACAAQSVEAGETAAALALAAPLRRPPAGLRDRVLREARRDLLQATPGAPPRPTREGSRAGGLRGPATGIAAALAALALVGVTAWAVTLRQEVADLRDENAALRSGMSRDAIARSVMEGGSRIRWEMLGTEMAPAATALLAWDPEERLCVLVVEGLPPAQEGQVYQLWLTKDDGTAVSLGMFSVDEQGAGRLVATLDGEFWGYVSAGVSMEPPGGSTVRQGPVMLQASLGDEETGAMPDWR